MKALQNLLPFLLVLSCTCSDSRTPEEVMLGSNFEGEWSIIGSEKVVEGSPFSKFSVDHGIALVGFTDLGKGSKKVEGVILELLTPQYYDQLLVKLIIQFSQGQNPPNLQWTGTTQVKYEIYDQTYLAGNGSAAYYYHVDQHTIAFSSNTQNLTIVIPYHQLLINPKTTLIFSLISFLILICVRRKNNISDQMIIRHQVIPIILATTLQFLVSVVQFIIGCNSLFGDLNPQAFFTVCGFMNLWACFYIMKYYHPIILMKKKMIIVSWITVILYVWMLLYFRHSYIFLIINSFVFLPEIIYHSVRGQKVSLDYRFILFCLSNQIYVIYFKVCPQNIFRESPNYLLGYCMAGILTFQVFLLIGQIYVSPRFFIPGILLPKKHNYFNDKVITKSIGMKTSNECYICLDEMTNENKKKMKLMVTPCNHVYHADCLKNWMAVKMQCPMDRKKLPAF